MIKDLFATTEQRIRVGLLTIMGLLVVVLFHVLGNTVVDVHSRSVFVWMVARWGDKISFGADYSYGWLIPFGSAFVIWRHRHELQRAETRLTHAGLVLIVLALFMHWAGAKVQQPRMSLLGLILLLWSVPYYLKGWAFAKWLIFPCSFLIFCIPLNFLDAMTFPLRLFATSCSTAFLNGLGIKTIRSGCMIFSTAGGGFNFDVADPCSGLRSLLSLTALIALYSYLTQKTFVRKWLLFLLAVPIAMAGNVVRVTTIAIVAVMFGQEKALVVYHDYSGYLIFVANVLLMLAAGDLVGKNWRQIVKKRLHTA